MSFKEKLSKLAEAVFSDIETETQEKQFAEARLDSGDVIQAEAFEPGNAAYLLSEDGSKTPMGEGEYMLEDGSRIMIDGEGIISEFMPAQAEEEEMSAEPETVEPTPEYVTKEELNQFKEEILDGLAQFAEASKKQHSAVQSEVAKKEKELSALKEKMHKPDPIVEDVVEKETYKVQEKVSRNRFRNSVLDRVKENLAAAK